MSVNPTESNDLEVDIVLPNFDLNVFEKEAAKKLTTSSTAKNRKTVKKTKPDWKRFDAYC